MWTPAYPDLHFRFPSDTVNLGVLCGICKKLLKWEKKSWRSFPPARKHARGRVTIFSVLFSVCNVNLHLFLSMVRGSPSLPTPAATQAPASAVFAVAGTRPDNEMATSSCLSRAACITERGPTVEWPLIAALVRATSVPACCVAPDHRPSLGVSQSRPMASAFAHGPWLDGCRIQ